MTEWFYKATPARVSYEETRSLAVDDGFICRSAHETNGTRADNTQHVRFGDLIHLYFVGEGEPKVVGTFEVVGPNRHPHGARFGKTAPGTALFEVDEEFTTKLAGMKSAAREGYGPDPVYKTMMGWALIPRTDVATPAFDDAPIHGMSTLVHG